MNKVPDIVGFRHNLQSWEQDQGRLKEAAEAFAAEITKPDNYEAFMQQFLGNQRTDSGFAFEIFGNPRSDGLPDDALLSLNTVDDSTLEKGYLIANGVKVNLDEQRLLIEKLSNDVIISLRDILQSIPESEQQKAKETITLMAQIDILEKLNLNTI